MRPEKQLLLDDIKDKIAASQAVVVARYSKLEPNKVAGFRTNLAKTGGSLAVVKKRVLLKAAHAAGLTLDADLLEGHIAVIFLSDDPFSTTKIIYQFSEENEKNIEVLGGRFEGALCSAKDVEQISKLPSKDEMRAQLLSVLEAPLSQTLAVVDALLTSVMHCLENKSQQNQSENQ
jgi:large subunit ribosomal protein L10